MAQNRIIGTEMEYGVMASTPEDGHNLKLVSNETLHPYVVKSLGELGISYCAAGPQQWSRYFLGNGGLVYPDVGDHREYATPEDTTAHGTVANEIAGEQIIQKAAELYSADSGNPTFVNKCAIDESNLTWGYHANYSADASRLDIHPEDLELFGVFAAVRSAIFGAGFLKKDGNFIAGQKSSVTLIDYSHGTMGSQKPVVNLRPEPLADPERWVRVHDTSGDPTMSPWASAVKFGAASIVLRLTESDRRINDLRFASPLWCVSQDVAHDTDLKQRFALQSGESISAVEAMGRIILEARKLEDEGGLSSTEQWALEEWDKGLADLEQDPRLVVDRVEWVLKRAMLTKLHERHGWSWKSSKLRAKDRQFSDLSERGIGRALRETAWANHMPPQDLIDIRLRNAPDTTRAHARGLFIKEAAGRPVNVNWHYMRDSHGTIHMADPFLMTRAPSSNEDSQVA